MDKVDGEMFGPADEDFIETAREAWRDWTQQVTLAAPLGLVALNQAWTAARSAFPDGGSLAQKWSWHWATLRALEEAALAQGFDLDRFLAALGSQEQLREEERDRLRGSRKLVHAHLRQRRAALTVSGRAGHTSQAEVPRLAPVVWRPFLQAHLFLYCSTPPKYLKIVGIERDALLCDLDERIASRCTREERSFLRCVLARRLNAPASSFGSNPSLRLPPLPSGFTLDDLRLESGTREGLSRLGVSTDGFIPRLSAWLYEVPVRHLLRHENLDACCLLDYAAAVEALSPHKPQAQPRPQLLEAASATDESEEALGVLPYEVLAPVNGDAERQHDERIGALLNRAEESSHDLHKYLHQIAWLLRDGWHSQEGAACWDGLRAALGELASVVDEAQVLAGSLEEGQSLEVERDVALEEELSQWRALRREMPDIEALDASHFEVGSLVGAVPIEGETLGEMLERAFDSLQSGVHPEVARGWCARLRPLRERLQLLGARRVDEELDAIVERFFSISRAETEALGEGTGAVGERRERYGRMRRRRLGWDGRGGATLRECAEEEKVTREWVRQICAPFETWLVEQQVFAPALRRAMTLAHERAPGLANDIARSLQDDGLVPEHWSLRSLLASARSMGWIVSLALVPLNDDLASEDSGVLAWPVEVDGVQLSEAGLRARGEAIVRRALDHLGRHVWERGIGNRDELIREIESTHSNLAGGGAEAIIRMALDVLPDVRWIDAGGGWFWMENQKAKRNQVDRLTERVRRALSVCNPLKLDEVLAALHRAHEYQRDARDSPYEWEMAEREVFAMWCRQVPWLRVREQDGEEWLDDEEPGDWRLWEPSREKTIVEVLHEHGPVLARGRLRELCIERRVPMPTFYPTLDGSCVIEEVEEGVFAPIGASATGEQIERARQEHARGNASVTLGCGRGADGRLWIRYRLSETMITRNTVPLPRAVRHDLLGEWPLFDEAGEPWGKVVFAGPSGWGLGRYLRRFGCEGDEVILTFDGARRRAVVAPAAAGN